MPAEENITTITRIYEAFGKGDIETILAAALRTLHR